jgi:hypothetical protein
MKNYSGGPTLNDGEVLEFCKKGFLMLEGVVADDVNRRTLEFVDTHTENMPSNILDEPWFVDGVILQPDAAGAVRSLLGNNLALPVSMSNHRIECPSPAQEWHTDGGSIWGPEVDYLQVFYYPQACRRDLGPTEVLPGSHFLYANRDYMAHYGKIRGSYYTVAPAGSIFITVYSIWHRRSESRGVGQRNLLKYNYWRTEGPGRDWLIDPDFDLETADYSLDGPTFRQQFHDSYDSARMYFWLRGESEEFRLIGGQGWPNPPYPNKKKRMGIPPGLGRP